MNNEVFNNSIGSPYIYGFPNLTQDEQQSLVASIFEQLLIFDRITISTSRVNFALVFLISNLGLKNVERLIDNNYIRFLLWTPMIFTGTGRQREDNTIDESVIYGQPPIATGSLSQEDLDPENNVRVALSHFGFHRDNKEL